MVEKAWCARFESASVPLNYPSQTASLQNAQHFLLLLIYFFASCATNESERDQTLIWVIYQSKFYNKAVADPGFPRERAPTSEKGTPIYFRLRGDARPWGPLGSATDSLLIEALSVADPGFPPGGGANSPGGANIRFCQILPKTAWNWKNLDPQGGARVQNFTMEIRHWL